MVDFARNSELHLYIGKSRSGKTRNMRAAMRLQAIEYPARRHVIVDPMIQFAAWEIRGRNIRHASESLRQKDTIIYRSKTEFSRIKNNWHKVPFHVIQGPSIGLLEDVIPLCMEAGGCNLWIDEIDGYGSKSTLPQELYELIHRGAHFGTPYYTGKYGVGEDVGWGGTGCGVVVAARRQANIHNDILAKCKGLHISYSDLPEDNHRLARSAGLEKNEFHALVSGLDSKKCEMVRFDEGHEVSGPEKWVLRGLTNPR